MAYKELVKDFNKVRDYMREFYVYGYKSRSEFSYKSKRSYDDERRRIESWLGDHIDDNTDADGKHVYISIDSRITEHNPLYKAWKTKSFTDGDITIHFIIFDILNKPEISLSLSEITDLIDEYLSEFDEPMLFDESTVRKKLKEYSEVGIINIRKEGRKVSYSRNFDMPDTDNSILDFFSEVAPCGVVGSYLLDKNSVIKKNDTIFVYKHHYIQSAMDSEVLYDIFCAIREKRYISIKFLPNDKKDIKRVKNIKEG